MSLDVAVELGRFPAERCQESHTGSKLPRKRDWLPPHCATHRRLYFGGLNLSNRRLDRLERLFGKVGIEFARVRYIPNELLQKRLGIFGLNLNGALKRFGAEQLFEESGIVLERLFEYSLDSAAIVCQPLASDDDEVVATSSCSLPYFLKSSNW